MRWSKNLPAAVLALLLAACVAAYFSTRQAANPGTAPKAADDRPPVDNLLLQTAQQLQSMAATAAEQAQAREAVRLADHEVGLAFAAALREAESAAAVPAKGPLKQLSDRIADLQAKVAADQQQVAALGKNGGGDDADLAQARLDLHQDELQDAQQDLAREGGDRRARLQQLLQQHDAEQKAGAQVVKYASLPATGTFAGQVNVWFALGGYGAALRAAGGQAAAWATSLVQQHETMEGGMSGQSAAGASVAQLRAMASQRQTLMGFDQRAQDARQLAAVYQQWSALADGRRQGVLHLLLGSLGAILGILLGALLATRGIRHTFQQADRRRLHQLRLISTIAVQVVALLLILLIAFGPPTQLSTILGLMTAGLTVVMKDFIVAFFGWFTLMGKNGISVGDWVEIEGVSGEVIEIGLLKTVLLELGNWTDTGHPTGRRVAFSNSFAMEKHYFNFSTSGQWLWDELVVALPAGGDPYEMAQQIREVVEKETEGLAAQAAEDWKRVASQYGAREFSARPAVQLQPGQSGLEVMVRYITRAPERNAVKSKLLGAIVDLLHKGHKEASVA